MKLLQELHNLLQEWYTTEPIGTIGYLLAAMEMEGIKTIDEFLEMEQHEGSIDEDDVHDALLTAGVTKMSDLPRVCVNIPNVLEGEVDWNEEQFRKFLRKKINEGFIYLYEVNIDGYNGALLAKHKLHGEEASFVFPNGAEEFIEDQFGELEEFDLSDLHDDSEVSSDLHSKQFSEKDEAEKARIENWKRKGLYFEDSSDSQCVKMNEMASTIKFVVRVRIPGMKSVAALGTELPANHLDSIRDRIHRDGISDEEAWKRAAFDNVRMALQRAGYNVNKVEWLSAEMIN